MLAQAALILAVMSSIATGGDSGGRALERGGVAPPAPSRVIAPEGGLPTPIFRATGVRDTTTAATVVHCTNLGTTTRNVTVEIFEFNGTLDCAMSYSFAGGSTHTFSTRLTALYFDDMVCETAPATEQGSLVVSYDGWTPLICTVEMVDPAHATPVFLERLSLYTAWGEYLGFRIFADDFESGNFTYWMLPPA